MSDAKVGVLIEGFAYRDAIHIAIAPVEAYDAITPGGQIKLKEGSTTLAVRCSHGVEGNGVLGIADPFLTTTIKKGQKFWMFLLPQTITGMRHQWMHPAFPFEVEEDKKSNPVESMQKKKSIKWMEGLADLLQVSVNDLVNAGDLYLQNGEHWCEGDKFDGVDLPDEYWKHYEIIRDVVVPDEQKQSFFSCSC